MHQRGGGRRRRRPAWRSRDGPGGEQEEAPAPATATATATTRISPGTGDASPGSRWRSEGEGGRRAGWRPWTKERESEGIALSNSDQASTSAAIS